MKNIIILISLLVYSFNCFAQDAVVDTTVVEVKQVLDGFWGIKFGSNQEVVRAAMLKKKDFVYNKNSNNEIMIFGSGTFAGKKATALIFRFYNNKFFNSMVIFEPDFPSKILDLYGSICEELTDKYFNPDNEVDEYYYPFDKGDENFETAISAGKTKIGSTWNFSHPSKNEFNKITVMVSSDMNIVLFYIDGYINSLVEEKEKEKISNDY